MWKWPWIWNGGTDEERFLEGPHSRKWEAAFLFRVVVEFIKGLRALHFVGPCVAVFGSARIPEDHPFYGLTREVGRELAKLGFTVMTGGGGGLMEAANRGAKEAGGRSVGCNILLPQEQARNAYLDHWVTIRYFFIRKVFLFKYSYAFVVMPGGVGTLDELFEAYTLIQTGKIQDFPIVLFGKDYWGPMMLLLKRMAWEGTISPADLDLILVTDSVPEGMAHIERHSVEKFRLRKAKEPRPARLLAED
ncbi:MAG: TIGR00730 family Rossman fold protein [Nitrospinota bacterium]